MGDHQAPPDRPQVAMQRRCDRVQHLHHHPIEVVPQQGGLEESGQGSRSPYSDATRIPLDAGEGEGGDVDQGRRLIREQDHIDPPGDDPGVLFRE